MATSSSSGSTCSSGHGCPVLARTVSAIYFWGALRTPAIIAATFAALTSLEAQIGRWQFDFASSDHGFVAGFADYPSREFDPALYDFVADRRARPANLGGTPALFIGGSNRSDDLFMFWKKRITGFPPNTAVRLTMQVEFASKYAVGLIGIGGAPGEGVTVKAGAVPFEPRPVIDPQSENWWRMNLDKGNQSVGGAEMTVVGHVGKPDDGTGNYALLARGQHGEAITVTTASDGSLWLVFGSDSGFEGRTELYYSRLTVWIDTAQRPALWLEPGTNSLSRTLVWNMTGQLETADNLGSGWLPVTEPKRPHVHSVNEPRRFWRVGPAPTNAR
jgi:hypothetical protein